MNRVIVQVPMSPELKRQAELASSRMGFSSLQETIRVLVTKLARRQLTVEIGYPEERLSPRAVRRYEKIIRDIDSGKTKTVPFDTTKDMMAYLHSL